MCGIVGHIGPQGSVEIVLEGLKRLEYRGYDSAGVSFVDENNRIQTYKKEGKLQNLVNSLEGKNIKSECSIGHTRWATHGKVNDTNSHPHNHESISLVHNGIIENANDFRSELVSKGYTFKSETDTEVFLALVTVAMDDGLDFREAIATSFKKIRGNSAFVVLNEKTREIIAVKKGAPLVCGMHDKNSQVLVSSDPYALVGLADKIYFPEDEVMCSLSGANQNLLSFTELDGTPSKRFISKVQEMNFDPTDKGDFEHYMLKEIFEQPGLIRALSQYYFSGDGESRLEKISKLNPRHIYLSACGTAAYAGYVIRDYLEKFNRIVTTVELASEFRYRNPIIGKEDLGVFISQSGETADTLAAQGLCKEAGTETVSIVNVEGSTLYRECSENLLIRAGVEVGVASTKAFTQMCLTGRLMSFAMSGDFKNEAKRKEIVDKYNLLAERIDEVLDNEHVIKEIAELTYNKKGYFFTGRNHYYPTALEGALKLKEIAYVHAEGYASGELKHGPIALIDEEMVNIAIVGPDLYEKTVSNIQEIKARKGIIISLGPKGDKELEEMSDYYIPLNYDGLDELMPIYVNVVNQLLAYHMAKFKGTDIDKPRNLAKSVTVE
ncbi:MAG: glutamine--fructose-6-phosphate transaminase (isomerizing) [Oligoflexia bacterium]|nr:glutamine--fructose-6-phosphate transaminase (isomerizing) [Oligoflexia bacterium]